MKKSTEFLTHASGFLLLSAEIVLRLLYKTIIIPVKKSEILSVLHRIAYQFTLLKILFNCICLIYLLVKSIFLDYHIFCTNKFWVHMESTQFCAVYIRVDYCG